MTKKAKICRAVSLALLTCFFVFSLTGCSTLRHLVGWIPFWDSKDKSYALTDKDIAQCVSRIRPYQNPEPYYLQACFFQKRKRHKPAIEAFKDVLSMDPAYVKAYNGIGVSYDSLGEFPKAIEYYEKALRVNPDLDYVLNNMGYSYLLQDKLDLAIDAFQKALNLNGNNRRYHNNLGLAYAEKGQFELALVEFRLAGNDASAHKNLALILYDKGMNVEAERHLHLSKASALGHAQSTRRGPIFARPSSINSKNKNSSALSTKIFSSQIDRGLNIRTGKRPNFAISTEIRKQPHNRPQETHVLNISQTPTQKAIGHPGELNTVIPPIQRRNEQTSATAGRDISRDQLKQETAVRDRGGSSNEETGRPTKPQHRSLVYEWKPAKLETIGGSTSQNNEQKGVTERFRPMRLEGEKDNILLAATKIAHIRIGSRKGKAEPKQKAEKNKILEITKASSMPEPQRLITKGKPTIRRIEKAGSLREKSKTVQAKPLGHMQIEVINGNGMVGMARRVADYLRNKGLNIVLLANAGHFGHEETKIFYRKGHLQDAYRVAQQIPGYQNMERVARLRQPNIKIKVLIGKDLIIFDGLFTMRHQAS